MVAGEPSDREVRDAAWRLLSLLTEEFEPNNWANLRPKRGRHQHLDELVATVRATFQAAVTAYADPTYGGEQDERPRKVVTDLMLLNLRVKFVKTSGPDGTNEGTALLEAGRLLGWTLNGGSLDSLGESLDAVREALPKRTPTELSQVLFGDTYLGRLFDTLYRTDARPFRDAWETTWALADTDRNED